MNEDALKLLIDAHDQTALPTGGHPDDEDWAQFAEGLLDQQERAAIIRHAADCQACAERLCELAAEVPAESSTAHSRTRVIRLFPMALFAAAAVVLVGLGLRFWSFSAAADDEAVALYSAADFGFSPARASRDLSPEPGEEYLRKLQAADAIPDANKRRLTKLGLAMKAGDWPTAGTLAIELGNSDDAPPRAAAFSALGIIQLQAGKFELAGVSFDQALKIKPDEPSLLLNCAIAADQDDKIAEARRFYRRLLEVAPTHPLRDEIESWLDRNPPEPE